MKGNCHVYREYLKLLSNFYFFKQLLPENMIPHLDVYLTWFTNELISNKYHALNQYIQLARNMTFPLATGINTNLWWH